MSTEEIIKRLQQYDFYLALDMSIKDSKYSGPDVDKVKRIIPADLDSTHEYLVSEVMKAAYDADKNELESIIRQVPAGYIRMNLRSIYRERFA